MNPFEQLLARVPLIEEHLGYTFKNKSLLALAFVHRSFFNENKGIVEAHNERLEFLGDSVLGVMVADYLYSQLPFHAEGQLSPLRSRLVEATTCAQYVEKLGLAPYILLGKGERINHEGGRGRETILADFFEALIGAIYLDGGLGKAKDFFLAHFSSIITHVTQEPLHNWKAELQDYSQKKHQKPPVYKVLEETGPDHSKIFKVVVMIEDAMLGHGEGSSKKQAEQAAAQEALRNMNSPIDKT